MKKTRPCAGACCAHVELHKWYRVIYLEYSLRLLKVMVGVQCFTTHHPLSPSAPRGILLLYPVFSFGSNSCSLRYSVCLASSA